MLKPQQGVINTPVTRVCRVNLYTFTGKPKETKAKKEKCECTPNLTWIKKKRKGWKWEKEIQGACKR